MPEATVLRVMMMINTSFVSDHDRLGGAFGVTSRATRVVSYHDHTFKSRDIIHPIFSSL